MALLVRTARPAPTARLASRRTRCGSPQGKRGPKGDTGAVGPQGPAGPKGDPGPAVSTQTVWLCLNTQNGNVAFGGFGATHNCNGSNVVARQAYLVPTT